MGSKQKKQPETSQAQPGKVQPNPAKGTAALESPSRIQALTQYFQDARVELGKVSWPTRKEVKATAFAVLILVVVMSFFLGIVDLILSKVVESILSIGI